MHSPGQRRDRYTRIPPPNALVLSRAAAAPTRVSSDMPKKAWVWGVCAVRVKIAVGVQSGVQQRGTCTAAAAREPLRGACPAAPCVPATSTCTLGAGCMHPARRALSAP